LTLVNLLCFWVRDLSRQYIICAAVRPAEATSDIVLITRVAIVIFMDIVIGGIDSIMIGR